MEATNLRDSNGGGTWKGVEGEKGRVRKYVIIF